MKKQPAVYPIDFRYGWAPVYQERFFIGKWLNAAKAMGTTPREKMLYEKNVRDLITLWGDKNNKLHEYANKQWAGLLNGFYKKRCQQFFNYVSATMKNNTQPEMKLFEEEIKNMEWQWVNSHENYPDQSKGYAVEKAKQIHRKYFNIIKEGTVD